MPARFQHFILTRFSVRASWAWQEFPREWLDTRLDLFERFCLPTIAAQSNPEFRWLVYCDETTDPECLDRLRGYRDGCPQLELAITAVGAAGHPIRMLDAFVEDATDVVITTRVDSDDGLHVDMVRTAQEYLEPFAASRHDQWLLNFPRGCKYDAVAQVPYHAYLDNSPFHTLFERPHVRRPILSVMSGNHSRLHQKYPTHQDHSLVGWLQVIYGGNVRNHVNPLDLPTDISILAKLFAVAPGPPREYWIDLPPQARPAAAAASAPAVVAAPPQPLVDAGADDRAAAVPVPVAVRTSREHLLLDWCDLPITVLRLGDGEPVDDERWTQQFPLAEIVDDPPEGAVELVADETAGATADRSALLLANWPRVKPGGIYAIASPSGPMLGVLKDIVDDVHARAHGYAPTLSGVASIHLLADACIIRKRSA